MNLLISKILEESWKVEEFEKIFSGPVPMTGDLCCGYHHTS